MAFIKDVCRWPDQAVCGVYLIPFFRLFQTSLNLSSSLSFPSLYSPLSLSLFLPLWHLHCHFPFSLLYFFILVILLHSQYMRPINRLATDLARESEKPYKSLEDRSLVFKLVNYLVIAGGAEGCITRSTTRVNCQWRSRGFAKKLVLPGW